MNRTNMSKKELEDTLSGKTEEEIMTLGVDFISTTLGIPKARIPRYRHTFATGLMILGIPMKELWRDESLISYEKEDGLQVWYSSNKELLDILFRFKNYLITP